MHHFLEHFTGSMTAYWADLGSPDLASPNLQKKIVDGVLEAVNGRSFEALSQERDNLIIGLLELPSHCGKTKIGSTARTCGRWLVVDVLAHRDGD